MLPNRGQDSLQAAGSVFESILLVLLELPFVMNTHHSFGTKANQPVGRLR